MGGLFSALTSSLAPFFMNPAVFIPGAALISAPIIIHLLNRLRFRKVQFAAMEFLLQSQKQNKRRILFEQLLLLLLRILIVLLIAALIARLILDPHQLAFLKGQKNHHLVLLDDSASMQDRWGETTAFEEGKLVIRKLVEEGSRRPGTQMLTVLLLSDPDDPFINGEDINEQLLVKLTEDLNTLKPTNQSFNLLDGLKAADQRLTDEKAISRTLHVISDFRESDWNTQAALKAQMNTFEENNIAVNLVRAVTETHPNVSIVDLTGDLQTAAVNVPLRLTARVKNHSEEVVKGSRLTVIQDGKKSPVAIPLEDIDAGATVSKPFDVVFGSPGRHELEVLLDTDALDGDNSRHLVVELLDSNPVLLINGDRDGREAEVVADALAPDPTLTGIAPLIQSPDFLRRNRLDDFRCIYLINVASLPEDAILPLKQYVTNGGGLAWFLGNLTDPNFMNTVLYSEEEKSLIPVPLGAAWRDLPRADEVNPGPDLSFAPHPISRIFQGEENPFVAAVHVDRYFPISEDVSLRTLEASGKVKTLVTLRNNQPLIVEHSVGDGRIITCLTSAGGSWNDWLTNPSFVIFHLEMQKYLAKRFQERTSEEAGTPISITADSSLYSSELEIISPDGVSTRLQMSQAERPAAPEDDGEDATGRELDEKNYWTADYKQTDQPGIYRVVLYRDEQTPAEERWLAYNAPLSESGLALTSDDDLIKRAGGAVELQTYEDLGWLQQRDSQQEIRMALLVLLFLFLLAEQLLAYRLSYHSRPTGAPAS
jgi:hypothetical protein